MLKIYFGGVPENIIQYNKDGIFAERLQHIEFEELIDEIFDLKYGTIIHSYNPWIWNYMNHVQAFEHIYYFDVTQNQFPIKNSAQLIMKSAFMQVGELLADSELFYSRKERHVPEIINEVYQDNELVEISYDDGITLLISYTDSSINSVKIK